MFEAIKESWDKIKEYIRDEYGILDVSYNTWISPLKPYSLDGNVLKVYPKGVTNNNEFPLKYVTKKYTLIFETAIEEILGSEVKVIFVPEPNTEEVKLFYKENFLNTTDSFSEILKKSNLNPKHTFDSFVVGASNKFAHAASLSVAESPGTDFNPLFLYGGPGLGKTHLMHSIGHFILNNNKDARVLYVTSETFTNEIIDGIRFKTSQASDIKNKYRNVDILLIDDIQFIEGKGATEDEFFNTFNFLYEHGKQIVMSSDRPPQAFTSLAERLRSRFNSGLTVDISSPDYETRMAILRKKEETAGYSFDNEILQYIATNIKSNIRDLEGALTKISAHSKLNPEMPLTLEIAKNILKDTIKPEDENKITPDYILKVVAEHYGVSPEDIKSNKRNKEIVTPRHVAMYIIRRMNDISLDDVGAFLGNRDHSTVIHGLNKINEDIAKNKELNTTIDIIIKKLSK